MRVADGRMRGVRWPESAPVSGQSTFRNELHIIIIIIIININSISLNIDQH
jgi:hypothetical protein